MIKLRWTATTRDITVWAGDCDAYIDYESVKAWREESGNVCKNEARMKETAAVFVKEIT